MPPARPLLHLAVALAASALLAPAVSAKKLSMPLNDTGMTQCLVNGVFTSDCTGTGQDGEFGRDVTANKSKDGVAGFSYQKICNSGEVAGTGSCPSNPKLGSGANKWGCTQDKVTKLIWEVKTADGGFRDWTKSYTNYGDGRSGDASAFVAKVNAKGLCGASNWVLPTAQQLLGLVVFRKYDPVVAMMDTQWFPNTTSGNDFPTSGNYWAADDYSGDSLNAWGVSFYSGGYTWGGRHSLGGVRLVRPGQ